MYNSVVPNRNVARFASMPFREERRSPGMDKLAHPRAVAVPSIAAESGSKARMSEHMDVRVRAGPLAARSTGTLRCARSAAEHRVRRLAFFAPFWAMPKRGPLARTASGKWNGRVHKIIRRGITRSFSGAPFGPFAARMFASASCLRSPAFRNDEHQNGYNARVIKTLFGSST